MAASATEAKISTPDNDRMRQAAEILLKARREVMPIHGLPAKLRPSTLDEAYALQDIMAQSLSPIGGWKVGAPTPDATPVFSAMPLLGGFAESGGRIAPAFRRMRGVEAEIAFCLGKDLPRRAEPYSREEVADAIATAHPAIEMLESAYFDVDKVDRFSLIGDLQMNGGFAYGAAIPDWRSHDLTRETASMIIDGNKVFEGTASNPAGTDLLRLVTWLANEGSYRTAGLKSGQWITTGSWSGKALANAGSAVEARFSTFGTVSLTFE
jgi:2-keto-4-pentenoate hydratase